QIAILNFFQLYFCRSDFLAEQFTEHWLSLNKSDIFIRLRCRVPPGDVNQLTINAGMFNH
ncbi:TPA: hypothetical protein ACIYDB_004318, partial [Escherichia coli]